MTPTLSQKRSPSHCDFCDSPLAPSPTPGPTGYGWVGEGKAACYQCCAWLDVIDMLGAKPGERAQGAFYFSREPATDDALGDGIHAFGHVSNWPGSLELKVFAVGRRYHVFQHLFVFSQRIYFSGPDGSKWSGTYFDAPASGSLLRDVRRLTERSAKGVTR